MDNVALYVQPPWMQLERSEGFRRRSPLKADGQQVPAALPAVVQIVGCRPEEAVALQYLQARQIDLRRIPVVTVSTVSSELVCTPHQAVSHFPFTIRHELACLLPNLATFAGSPRQTRKILSVSGCRRLNRTTGQPGERSETQRAQGAHRRSGILLGRLL